MSSFVDGRNQHADLTSFFKATRRGKIVRSVAESYSRNQLCAGYIHGGKELSILQLRELVRDSQFQIVPVIDTNIAFHQIDAIEHMTPVTTMMVVGQTLLNELKSLSPSCYKRVMELLRDETRTFIFLPNECFAGTKRFRTKNESVNDFNDRCLVEMACFINEAMDSAGEVVFITNDIGNKERAKLRGLKAVDMSEYVKTYGKEWPELYNKLSASSHRADVYQEDKAIFPEYLAKEDIAAGIRMGTLHSGIFRINDLLNCDCYVVINDAKSNTRKIISIQGELSANRAIDGDTVAVMLCPESVVRPTVSIEEEIVPPVEQIEGVQSNTSKLFGKVVGIVKRCAKLYCGTIDEKTIKTSSDEETTFAQFIPVNKRVPRVWISSITMNTLIDARLQIAIDLWPNNSLLPFGHYVEILGAVGNKDVETSVLLQELDINSNEFSNAVMACLPPLDWQIGEKDLTGRQDFRAIPIVSIDPPGCKDIDDALHCVKLANNRWQVGVHIADVTHFVHPNTPLDEEAAKRSTSTYLVERRLDMLPGLLTTQLCSLRSDEDHLAFSVIWEMDDNANILDVKFCKSVIRSQASLTYDQAQTILDKGIDLSSPISVSVCGLNKFAHILRRRRIDSGALTLASAEVRFKLEEETRDPTDIALYNLKEANALVEEWMLLANITVAKKILKHYPTLAVLRRHQPPSKEQFLPLVAAAAASGVKLEIATSKTLADSLDAAVKADDLMFNKLLRILATRCMMPAQYFCSGEIPKDQWHHYGLATQVYTHFTSPIRRYADVVVHRLLAAAIGVIPLPTVYSDRSRQQNLCSHMNRRHRAAQEAQRASVAVYTVLYFKEKKTVETGYVLKVGEKSLSVMVPKFGLESSILFDDVLTNGKFDFCDPQPQNYCVVFASSKTERNLRLQVLQSIVVEISVVKNDSEEKVKLSIVVDKN